MGEVRQPLSQPHPSSGRLPGSGESCPDFSDPQLPLASPRRECLGAVSWGCYFPILISIEETLLILPSMVLLTCSVLMEMDCTLMSVANRFVNT